MPREIIDLPPTDWRHIGSFPPPPPLEERPRRPSLVPADWTTRWVQIALFVAISSYIFMDPDKPKGVSHFAVTMFAGVWAWILGHAIVGASRMGRRFVRAIAAAVARRC